MAGRTVCIQDFRVQCTGATFGLKTNPRFKSSNIVEAVFFDCGKPIDWLGCVVNRKVLILYLDFPCTQ